MHKYANIIKKLNYIDLLYKNYSDEKYNYYKSSQYNQHGKEPVKKVVISVWSEKINEKEYAYRWCISGRNKDNSN